MTLRNITLNEISKSQKTVSSTSFLTQKQEKSYNTLLRDVNISDKIIFKKQGMTQVRTVVTGSEHIQYGSFLLD